MARLRYNGVTTTLGASLSGTATAVTFVGALTQASGANVPTISGSDYIPLTLLDVNGRATEVVYLTAYTAGATTGTVTRAQEGTVGVSHASGDKVIHGPTAADFGGVLACNSYEPATITSFPIAATTVTDIDATNMAVTFIAPPSGNVVLTLTALYTPPGGNGNYLNWHLRNGTTTVATKYVGGTTNVDNMSACVQFKVTGLTGGTSYTYKWAQSRTGTGSANTHAGGIAGAAVMKVESAP